MAEEELLEYYKTNDIEGKYFPTRYTLYSEDYIIECSSSEALLTAASEEYGVSFQDMPELNNYLGEHEDKGYYIEYKLVNRWTSDSFLSYHKYSLKTTNYRYNWLMLLPKASAHLWKKTNLHFGFSQLFSDFYFGFGQKIPHPYFGFGQDIH